MSDGEAPEGGRVPDDGAGDGGRERRGGREAADEGPGGASGGGRSASRPPSHAQGRDGMVGDPDVPGAAGRGAGGGGRRYGRRGEGTHPERVSGAVRALFEKLGIAEQVERAAAAGRWEEVVGAEIARRTGAARVDGRTLFVEVESASWMQELDMRRHQILRRINEEMEGAEIEKIVFVQEGRETERGGGR